MATTWFLIGLLPALVAASHPSGAAQQPPQFRGGTDLIQVDVIVTDDRGRPIEGLTRDDFELFEDGRPMRMTAFEPVRVPEAAFPTAILPAEGSGVGRATNEHPGDGRLVVIVFDDLSVPASRFLRARRIALGIIDRLGPADRAAAIAVTGRAAHQVDFTMDRGRLRSAFDRFSPGESNTGDNLAKMLARLSRWLESVPQRRKTIVLISEGGLGLAKSATVGETNRIPELQEFVTAAQRANAAVYAFHTGFPGGLDAMVESETPGDWTEAATVYNESVYDLKVVSENTGGFSTTDSNNVDDPLDRMMAENGSYYLLGYPAPTGEDDHEFRRIQVKVGRPGVVVRARPGYWTGTPSRERSTRAASDLDRLVRAPIPAHGLGLRVLAIPAPWPSRRGGAVLLVTEVAGRDLAGATGLELMAIAVDSAGRIAATDRYRSAITERSSARDDRWVRIAWRLELRPGRYQVRVAGRRTDGQAEGATFAEVEVPDFRRGFSLGGFVLGTPDWRGVARADLIRKAIAAAPIAGPHVPSAPAPRAVLPVRTTPRACSRVTFEPGLAAPNGAQQALPASTLPSTTFAGDGGGLYELGLPADLPAGPYTLTVDVTCGTSTARREISFSLQ